MAEPIITGSQIRFAEAVAQDTVPFTRGQIIIEDSGEIYYDSTQGESVEDRLACSNKFLPKPMSNNLIDSICITEEAVNE